MAIPGNVVCFTCSQATGPELRLNRLPDGSICPTCRDRVLDAVPACLPSQPSPVSESRHEPEHAGRHEPAGRYEPDDDGPQPA